MFRRFLQIPAHRNGTVLEDDPRGAATQTSAPPEVRHATAEPIRLPTAPTASAADTAGAGVPPYESFEAIYRAAPTNRPRMEYSILKVIEMLNSPHLAGMGPEAKRGSLLMALAAVGAEVTDILHDAMLRQRALNDYEELQQTKLAEFEAVKAAENRAIQAELDRLKAVHLERIQANMDEIARHQDTFRSWQKNKQKELHAIAEASSYCAPADGRTDTLAAVFEHAAGRM